MAVSLPDPKRPLPGQRKPAARRPRAACRRAAAGLPAFAALCVFTALPALALPTFDQVKAAYRPSDIAVLDRNGTTVQTLRVDAAVRRLPWVALGDVSPALLHAIVLGEDRRFHEHAGVDWGAVAKSAWANAWNTRTRGASTLTMQLAGLLDAGLARPAGGRSVAAKMAQAVEATRLDAAWRKSQILEAYLNLVAWRGEIVGIEALAQTLFGKHAGGLDAHEAALAAALLRGPNAGPATVAERACGLLRLQQLPCAGVAALAAVALARQGAMPLGEQLAPHFARRALAREGRAPGADASAALRTTLDARLQRFAVATLRRQLAELAGRHVEDAAALVLDNASGDVLAYVGSSGSLSAAAAVDFVAARRQPGSTLKPFVYELAFERRLITPASLLDDSPAQLATGAGLYTPQNYDRGHRGWVSARTALGASLNVPAVRVGALLGPDALFERLNAWGLALPESGGYYGHALALGGAEVTLLHLTNAYRALANGGVVSAPRLRPDDPPGAPRRVAEAAAVHLVTDILADDDARVATFGFGSALATRGWAAAKTGTSKDLRDNWCIGYTARHTVGVWVGNASGAPMHDVGGTSGAAPAWRAIVGYLQERDAGTAASGGAAAGAPAAPPGVVMLPVTFEGGVEAPRREVFLAGTEQPVQRLSAQVRGDRGAPGARYGIRSPRDGSVYAFDPDMPPAAQRIIFEGEAGTWVLDGKHLGRGATWQWAPRPGRHALRLIGRDGAEVERVGFEVGGAGVAAKIGKR